MPEMHTRPCANPIECARRCEAEAIILNAALLVFWFERGEEAARDILMQYPEWVMGEA